MFILLFFAKYLIYHNFRTILWQIGRNACNKGIFAFMRTNKNNEKHIKNNKKTRHKINLKPQKIINKRSSREWAHWIFMNCCLIHKTIFHFTNDPNTPIAGVCQRWPRAARCIFQQLSAHSSIDLSARSSFDSRFSAFITLVQPGVYTTKYAWFYGPVIYGPDLLETGTPQKFVEDLAIQKFIKTIIK